MSTPGTEPPVYGPPPRRRRGALIVGLVVGLVVGAGGLGLVWALVSGDSATDYDAVCGLVARTEPLTKDFELGDLRRLSGVGELAAAMAEADSTHKPLAAALENSVQAAQILDLELSAPGSDRPPQE